MWVDEHARTTVAGLYAAGDLACVPHNYMIGAFVYGDLAGEHAASTLADLPAPVDLPADQVQQAHKLIYRPLRQPDGPPQPQVEFKLRRFVNDYVAPPKTATKLSIAVQTFDRMIAEVQGIGARTPHELMRAAEVSFIRDCAEMAARSSLTRTESRWGLYHDRADLPERDDEKWRYHLNLRKAADGTMEFLKRPVEPYFVPVPDLEHLPSEGDAIAVAQPHLHGGRAPAAERSRVRAEPSGQPPSPRIAAVLALEEPTLAQLDGYLADPDPGVRRTAVATLVEHLPDGYQVALQHALGDDDARVRLETADAVRELVEVLPDPGTFASGLDSPDPVVRAATVYLLSARRAGDASAYRAALTNADHRVRIEAVRALVSVDDTEGVAAATRDENREVRIAAANGLATLQSGADAVRVLLVDPDPLVRAAALASLGAVGCDDADVPSIQRALGESAWQIRQGAARALAGAQPAIAVPTLSQALADQHLDVRKAAVLSLSRWADTETAAREALAGALDDGDADVRAYARQALSRAG